MRNRLVQLLSDNRNVAGRQFSVRRASDACSQPAAEGPQPDDAVEILLYDAIVDSEIEAEWWGGVAPEPFVRTLRGITAREIHLRLNSPGGSVFAARAMEQALREHSARIIVHVDGYAASAASFLAMAGDEIIMGKGAMMMIHKSWTFTWGNADELKKTADLLDKIDGTLVQTYADRSGSMPGQIASWMDAETWFTAQEAVDAGLADSISDAGADPKALASWNLAAYLRAPGAGADEPPKKSRARDPSLQRTAQESAAAGADQRIRQQQRLRALSVAAPIE